MTKRDERVYKYLQKNYITQKEAINKLGNYRLSASIFNLKEQGIDIDGVFIKVYNRFKEQVRIKAYYLKENEEKVMKRLKRLGYVK